jgi:hypothetical protein
MQSTKQSKEAKPYAAVLPADLITQDELQAALSAQGLVNALSEAIRRRMRAGAALQRGPLFALVDGSSYTSLAAPKAKTCRQSLPSVEYGGLEIYPVRA